MYGTNPPASEEDTLSSTRTIRVGVINPDDTVITTRRITADLATFQALVGGYIEHVDFGIYGLYLNEEGKLNGLPINRLATELWSAAYGPTDILVGPVVLVGLANEDGDDTDLPVEVIDHLRNRGFRIEDEA